MEGREKPFNFSTMCVSDEPGRSKPVIEPCSFHLEGSYNHIIIQKGDNNKCCPASLKAYDALLKENKALRELLEMWKSIALK